MNFRVNLNNVFVIYKDIFLIVYLFLLDLVLNQFLFLSTQCAPAGISLYLYSDNKGIKLSNLQVTILSGCDDQKHVVQCKSASQLIHLHIAFP